MRHVLYILGDLDDDDVVTDAATDDDVVTDEADGDAEPTSAPANEGDLP